MVLLNASLEPSHPPTSVSFPLGAPTLLADVHGSPEAHILAPHTFTERYPVVASVMRPPDMHSMVAVGVQPHLGRRGRVEVHHRFPAGAAPR